MTNGFYDFIKESGLSVLQVSRDLGYSYQWTRVVLGIDESGKEPKLYKFPIHTFFRVKDVYGYDMMPEALEAWNRDQAAKEA